MFPGIRLGGLFGFPIRIHASFLVLLGVVLLFSGGLAGLVVVSMVAVSVVIHELGHALVARQLGVPVREIGLHFFGGAAQMGLPGRARDEIAIAAAGPAVSFALGGLGYGLALVTRIQLFAVFGWVNLMLATFNLLPAFPSDGGRILRAWLARRRGFVPATDLAVKVGRGVCVLMIAAGLYLGSLQLVLVAVVLWTIGSAEKLSARLRGGYDPSQGDPWSGGARSHAEVDYLPPGEVWSRSPFPPPPRRIVVRWR